MDNLLILISIIFGVKVSYSVYFRVLKKLNAHPVRGN